MISIFLGVIGPIQLVSIILIVILFLLGFKLLETTWSYKISKPFEWDAAVRRGEVSKKLKQIERGYRDKVRFFTFWFQVKRLRMNGIQGAMAELGVYKGVTARMLHLMEPSRKFYLLDTFEGFSEEDLQFENQRTEKLGTVNFMDTDLPSVKQFIDGNENVVYVQGYFSETISGIPEEKFALVHLDADLYQPTLAALHYFYPRLSPGGVLIIHDYNHDWAGVRKAVDEFMPGIREAMVFIADWQGSVIVVKNLQ